MNKIDYRLCIFDVFIGLRGQDGCAKSLVMLLYAELVECEEDSCRYDLEPYICSPVEKRTIGGNMAIIIPIINKPCTILEQEYPQAFPKKRYNNKIDTATNKILVSRLLDINLASNLAIINFSLLLNMDVRAKQLIAIAANEEMKAGRTFAKNGQCEKP